MLDLKDVTIYKTEFKDYGHMSEKRILCPSCKEKGSLLTKLPISGLVGSVTVFCKKCKKVITITSEPSPIK